MALAAQLLLSSSSVPQKIPILRLQRYTLESSSFCKCFLHPHRSQSQTPRRRWRRNQPVARPERPRFLRQQGERDDDEHGVQEDMWGLPACSSGAHFVGALDDEEGGDGCGPLDCDAAEEAEQLQGCELGGWDPAISLFPTQAQEQHRQEDEDEEEEDGGDCAWWDPTFFLRGQEEVSSTTTAMEDILAFARSPVAAGGPGFAEFLAGYISRALGEDECVELMKRMGEDGLPLGCLDLFRWMRALEEQPTQQAWLVALVVLGQAGMADEVLEILGSLPQE